MTRISLTFSLLCILYEITSSFAFVFEDCGSKIGKLNEISISSCDVSEERCVMTRGSEVEGVIKFTPSQDVSEVTMRAYCVMLDVDIPVPLEEPNLCKDSTSGIKCPLKKDQEVEYRSKDIVDKKSPPVSIDLKVEFVNEKNETIICVKYPTKVV